MANKYEGTQTEKNLQAAFAGESQARNKYTFYASKAKKEGFEQISALFLKTADNEKEHKSLFFSFSFIISYKILNVYKNLLTPLCYITKLFAVIATLYII